MIAVQPDLVLHVGLMGRVRGELGKAEVCLKRLGRVLAFVLGRRGYDYSSVDNRLQQV